MFEKFEKWPELAALRIDFESKFDIFKAEALSLVDRGAFEPWREPELYDGSWEIYGLVAGGREVSRKTLAPQSREIVMAWNAVVYNAGFCLLGPCASIHPHIGFTADVVRYHLGLIVPSEDPEVLGIRVGNEKRAWSSGGSLLFDDTLENESWNRSPQQRIVLLVDLLRSPERGLGARR